MSCISLDLRMLNEPLVLSTERIGGISVSTSLIGNPINFTIFDALTHPKVNFKVIPNLDVEITPKKEFFVHIIRASEEVKVGVRRHDEPLDIKVANLFATMKARCSIVCSLKELPKYLNVSPSEIQWISQDYGVIYDVESNVEWIIVTP